MERWRGGEAVVAVDGGALLSLGRSCGCALEMNLNFGSTS